MYLLYFVLTIVLGLLLTPVARSIAIKYNIVDMPIGGVKTHKTPVAYLGGFAVFLCFVLVCTVLSWTNVMNPGSVVRILVPGTLLMILGLIDDLNPLKARSKLIIQFFISILAVLLNQKVIISGNTYFDTIFYVVWIVGLSNAYNIIDIMDGLSAGNAAVSLLVISFITAIFTPNFVTAMSLVLAGAILGFLRYNWAPARIYLGDTGSLFIGYMLAILSAQVFWVEPMSPIWMLGPVLLNGIAIFDTAFVSILRLKRGQSPMQGSKDHFALRLLSTGLQKTTVVLLTYGISIVLGFVSFLVYRQVINVFGIFALTIIAVGIGKFLSSIGNEQLGIEGVKKSV